MDRLLAEYRRRQLRLQHLRFLLKRLTTHAVSRRTLHVQRTLTQSQYTPQHCHIDHTQCQCFGHYTRCQPDPPRPTHTDPVHCHNIVTQTHIRITFQSKRGRHVWLNGVVVSALGFEFGDPGSIPGSRHYSTR